MVFTPKTQPTSSGAGGSRSRTATEEQYLLPTTSPAREFNSPTAFEFGTSPYQYHYDDRQHTASSPIDHQSHLHSNQQTSSQPRRTTRPPPSMPHYTYPRRETAHDVALLELDARLIGGKPNKEASFEATMYPLPGSFPSTPEEIYDPYTGLSKGMLGPLPPRSSHSMRKVHERGAVPPGLANTGGTRNPESIDTSGYHDVDGQAPPSPPGSTKSSSSSTSSIGREAELWDALAKVRLIQSEVAKKHLAMEGLGSKSTMPGAGGGRPTPKRRRSSRSSRERVELDDEFTGRREAIDEIMKKLDELSFAVKGFHDLSYPTNIDLPPPISSRSSLFSNTTPQPGPTSSSPYLPYPQFSPPTSPLPQSTSPRPSYSARSPLPPIIDSADEHDGGRIGTGYYFRSTGGVGGGRRFGDSPTSTQASFTE